MINASLGIPPKYHIVNLERRHKYGDVREDGFIFLTYSHRTRPDGSVYVRERWASPTTFFKHQDLKKRSYQRIMATDPERIRAIRRRYKARPEIKERARQRAKERNQRPEVKARGRECMREKRKSPEFRAREAQKMREWRKNPAVKERMRKHGEEYRKRPEVIERQKLRMALPHVKERTREMARLRSRKRAAESPAFRLVRAVRARVHDCLRKHQIKKSQRTFEYVGCSPDTLRLSLECRFEPGMTWQNYGTEWHVDHIIPLAAYNLTDPEQQREAFHYTNLQPMWAHENMAKGDEVPGTELILRLLEAA